MTQESTTIMLPPKKSTLRCTISESAIWKALSLPKFLQVTSSITSIEIRPLSRGVSESMSLPDVFPPLEGLSDLASEIKASPNTTEDQAAVERELITALQKMKSLKHFTWRHDSGPVLEHDLWSTLNNLGTVSSLRIIDRKGAGSDKIEYNSIFESFAVHCLLCYDFTLSLTDHSSWLFQNSPPWN